MKRDRQSPHIRIPTDKLQKKDKNNLTFVLLYFYCTKMEIFHDSFSELQLIAT